MISHSLSFHLRAAVFTVLALLVSQQCANADTQTFSYTGAQQSFVVPPGVTSISFDLAGAAGGSSFPVTSSGGLGGRTVATYPVTPGSTLFIYVGGAGGNGGSGIKGAAGFNGGGLGASHTSSYAGGGGGGASDVRIGGSALANRVLVAGGGGGGALNSGTETERGGAGGGLTGGTGLGYQGQGVGTGGTQVAGGTGGTFPGHGTASNGTLGTGGSGLSPVHNSGGGGGGGYYGGGGGAWSGGGGGSSFTGGSATGVTLTQGFKSGNGSVVITYTPSASNTAPSITNNASAATASLSFPENSSATIIDIDATDADLPAQTITFSKSGADAALFNLSAGGVLTFGSGRDFESFSDANLNGVYEVTVTATDDGSPSNLSDSQALSITITDVNEMPSFTKGADQVRSASANSLQTIAGWATAIDDGDSTAMQALTFNITDNTNAGLFTTAPAISSTGTLTYTPNGTAGTATISVTLTDDNSINGTAALTSGVQTFTITMVTPEIVVYNGATITAPELTDGQVQVVDFGTTTQGGGSVRSLTIQNTGDESLAVSSITAPAGFSVAGAPATVAPGANATFTVTLTAASTGTFSGNVVINSNDLDEPAFDFPVTGVVNPQVVVTGGSPNAVVNVELGSQTGFTVTVRTPTPAITTYTLQRSAGSGNWLGTDVPGVVTGFGTVTLNIIKAGVTTVNITDSNGANSVTFEGRAATTDATRIYEDDFTVMLNGALAGGVVFSGNNEFTGSASLTVAARGVAVGNVINVQANTTLQSANGNITLSGNYFLADAPSGGGTFYGITQQGTIKTTGSGNIVLNGRGGSGSSAAHGINTTGATITVEGTGTVTLTGIGGMPTANNAKGISMVNTAVSSAAGAITLTGTSLATTGIQHHGILLQSSTIEGTNALVPVVISLNGTGANTLDLTGGARTLHGVEINNASRISTAKGSISIVGVAGTLPAAATGSTNYGVAITGTSEVSSTGDATISIDGTGGAGGSTAMTGVLLNASGAGWKVSVADGNLSITGTSGGSGGSSENGVQMGNSSSASVVESTGSGNIVITGKRAVGALSDGSEFGFQMQGSAGGMVRATGTGNITINADSVRLASTSGITTSSGDVTLRPYTAGLAVNVGGVDSLTQLGLTDTELDFVSAGTGRLIIGGSSTGVVTQSAAISRAATTNVVLSSGSALLPAINLSSGALTSTNGNVTLTGDAISIGAGTIVAGAGTVTLQPQTAGTLIDLGGLDVAGTLGLTDGELDKISAAALTVGSVTSGAISMSESLSRTSATGINLISSGAITVSQLIDSAGGNVQLTPGTSVSPTASGTDVSMVAGTLSFPGGGELALSIESGAADSGYQQLKVGGLVDLTGVSLALSGSFVPLDLQAFTLVNNDGIDPITGEFSGLTEQAQLTFNGKVMWITYVGGDGNDVVLRTSGPPVVTTQPASSITGYTATLHATVTANALATTTIFEYSRDPAFISGVISTTSQNTGNGTVGIAVSQALAALTADTDYYFRVVAENSSGISTGSIFNFRTNPPVASDVYFNVASGLQSTGEIYRPMPGVINAAGRISFKAFGAVGTGGTTTANDDWLMSDTSGSLMAIGQEGTAVPGGGSLSGTFNNLVLSTGGRTVTGEKFAAATTAADFGYLISEDGSSLEVLSRESDSALGGGLFTGHTGRQAVDGSDRVYFPGALSGVVTTKNSGVWYDAAGSLALYAKEGLDVTSQVGDLAWLGNVSLTLSAAGDGVAFTAALQNNPDNSAQKTLTARNAAIFSGAPGSLELVARKGDLIPAVGKLSTFSGVSRGAAGDHAFLSLLAVSGVAPVVTSANDQALLAEVAGSISLVARENTTELLAGLTVARFGSFYMTSESEVIFQSWVTGSGVTTSNDSFLCRWSAGGGIEVLAREGASAPGTGVNYGVFQALSVSPGGAVALQTTLTNGRIALLRAMPGASLGLVVQTTQTVMFGSSSRTILSLSINSTGAGSGGGGGGLGDAINDEGAVFTVLSIGSSDYVARIFRP